MHSESITPVATDAYLAHILINDGCWLWRGSLQGNGYGSFSANGRSFYAHRYAWMIANNRLIPDGMFVCHHCDNPPCTNPSHLFLGTRSDNELDAANKGKRGPKVYAMREGEGNGHSKLTNANVAAIRAIQGITYAEIARQFGISINYVGCIRRRVRWTHLP